MDRVEKIVADIENIRKVKKGRIVIAIDGRCGSGKTTLAFDVAKKIDASILHSDSFSVPFEMKTEERLSIPGGNLHSERLVSEVLEKLDEKVISYHPFDYSIGRIADRFEVIDKDILIVEGAYSLLPELRKYYDECYMIEEELEVRLERLLKREGNEKFKMFLSRWIPLEEKYFSAYDFSFASII